MKTQLITLLAKTLYQSGATSDMIERAIYKTAKVIKINAVAFALPKTLWIEIDGQMSSVDCHFQEVNLERIGHIEELISELNSSNDILTAYITLENIGSSSPYLKRKYAVLAYAGLAFGTSVLFNGSLQDQFGASILGAFSAILLEKLRNTEVDSLATLILATCLSILSVLFSIFGASPIALLSGVIIVVPGFTMTIALSELAAGQLVSGTSRLYGSLVQFFSLAIGLSVGLYIKDDLPIIWQAVDAHWSLQVLGLAILPLSLAILFRVPKQHLFLSSTVGLLISLSSLYFSSVQATFIVTLLLGFVGSFLPKVSKVKREVIIWPSLLLLVPGATALAGIQDLFHHHLSVGAEKVVQALLCSFLLVIALQISQSINFLQKTKKTRQNSYI